ncbi:heme lyase CcmF/NrfE family subunit [Plantactinospora endophytica]|uniref:Cytochrome c biogenesis protein CcmF n=1 Tax=Plantactinospora endophytica TaxID=673535 RepID=A0ABQ4E6X1_9ACTN|nr:cytochrome c-type biogenesis CcmF C-terminal domain-containing protein [Plantactinospora endophytica]GIG90463.1 cytochrome c biogenesis protein CcmF [Plantactinospora endophytica]
MTGQVGTGALGVGLAASVAATLLWLRHALSPAAPVRSARLATVTALTAAVVACGALEWALLRHDFSLRFVAENGGRHVPLYYTVTGLWSALDGSLLLWLLILTGYAALLARTVPAGDRRLQPWAMTTVGVVVVFFFALSYFAANPFHPVSPVPADGPGPNPLLREHPAMGLHPPLLYAGYVGLVVPFGYALAGLLAGPAGRRWTIPARRWALLAWTLLTTGILLGAWWSYAVLGWGGYWAWDPVENASLLPWLTATAFLHSIRRPHAAERTGWPVGLACASFLLVLLGTFLTRSGVVASVHAFTESPLGPILLGFLLLTAVGTVLLIGWRLRVPADPGPSDGTAPLSRSAARTFGPTDAALLGNRIMLTTIAAVVLAGTLAPLLAEALSGSTAAVGPAYFNRTVVPLAIGVLVLVGLAPLLSPAGSAPGELARRAAVPAGVALAGMAVPGLLSRPGPTVLAAFGCAGFALTATAVDLRRRLSGDGGWRAAARSGRLGGPLAHAGIALVAVGAAASAGYTGSVQRELAVGESLAVSGATARLTAIDRAGGDTGMTVRARLALGTTDRPTATAVPELTYDPRHDLTVSSPAIRTGLLRDTYTTLLAVSADGRTATVRLAVNPMVSLVWAGGALTALGGLLALPTTRRRARVRSGGVSGESARPAVPAAPGAVG